MSQRGYWAKHQDGEMHFHEAPERERCSGSGVIRCLCGGDLCVCGNQGEIDCYGCLNCERDDDDCEELDADSATGNTDIQQKEGTHQVSTHDQVREILGN